MRRFVYLVCVLASAARADNKVHYLTPPRDARVAAVVRAYHAGPLLAAADELVRGMDGGADVPELIRAIGLLATQALEVEVPTLGEVPLALRFLVAIERGRELAAYRREAEGALRPVINALAGRASAAAERGDEAPARAATLIAQLDTPLAVQTLLRLVQDAPSRAVRVVAAGALQDRVEARIGRDALAVMFAETCAKALLE